MSPEDRETSTSEAKVTLASEIKAMKATVASMSMEPEDRALLDEHIPGWPEMTGMEVRHAINRVASRPGLHRRLRDAWERVNQR